MNLAFQVRSFSSSGISTSNAQRHLFQAVRIGLESPQCRKEVSAWDVELLHSQDSEVLLPSPPPIAVLVACGGASASWPWRSVPMHGVFAASSASPFPASSPWVFLEHTVVAEVRTTKIFFSNLVLARVSNVAFIDLKQVHLDVIGQRHVVLVFC